MKVDIVTIYDANNVGAFLQGYSLQTVLSQLYGAENVEFLRMPRADISNSKLSKVLFYLKQRKIRQVWFKYKTSKKYAGVASKLRMSNDVVNETMQYDRIVIGSDEVWNLEASNFTHHSQYFGRNIRANVIVAYAPSSNNTSKNTVINQNMDFSAFKSLSVRDKNTFNLVKEIDGRSPQYVCDPTLLVDSMEGWYAPVNRNGYILVYSYELNKNAILEIRKYAKKVNKKLISVGTYNHWRDEKIVVNPLEFLGWMKSADAVVTSTFHGTVLATRFHKQIAVYAQTSHKVQDFLSRMGMEDRNVTDIHSLESVFSEKIDYERVGKRIDTYRKESLEFLQTALQK